ncbi:DUF6311 domain-containing protein [Flavobacterium sp.]|uniref:DUF6311 domain-containing protein n=1 Tax=Flavobacterium sp. TaxID=239 RepID=UPI00391BA3DB
MKIKAFFEDKHTIIYLLSFVIVLIFFQISYGLDVVLPTNIAWLLDAHHDWGTHYLGWAFYRNEPWTFPLGHMENLCYPVGTNVGYFDSIPLLALFFKIFSGILSDDFQFLGAWLLFCQLMLAVFVVKIAKLYNLKGIYILAGVILIACNPVLIYRGMHPSLCCHFFILGSLYYYLKPLDKTNVIGVNNKQVYLLLLSSLISPYVCFMIIGFNFILPFKSYFYDKLISLKRALVYPIVSLFLVLILWSVFGMVDFSDSVNLEVQNSYGLYGFNLNSFFNSSGFSSIFPALPQVTPFQYEGFMYLGLGMMILIGMSLIVLFTKKKSWAVLELKTTNLPLLILVIILSLFAVSNKVTYGSNTLFEYPLPSLIMKAGGVFRASGRFVWVAYYLIMLLTLMLFVKSKYNEKLKITVIAIIVFIQLYDIKTIYLYRDLKSGTYTSPLSNEKWSNLLQHFDRVITYPPFNNNLLRPWDYQDLCFLALKSNKAISAGYAARENLEKNHGFIDSLNTNLNQGIIFENELMVTAPKYLDAFSVALHNKTANITYLDGYYLLYSKKNKGVSPIVLDKKDQSKIDSVYNQYNKSNVLEPIDKPGFKDDFQFNIEELNATQTVINISGWVFRKGINNNQKDSIFVAVSNNSKTYLMKAKPIKRPDINEIFNKGNLDNAGFSATVFAGNFKKGKYDLGLAIKSGDGKWFFSTTGNIVDIGREDFVKPVPLKKLPKSEGTIGNVDFFEVKKDYVSISGWAAFQNQDSKDNGISIVFIGSKGNFCIPTQKSQRKDVTAFFKSKYNYDNSGFSSKMKLKDLPKGEYKVALLIKNKAANVEALYTSKQILEVK